jgi:hypothetical protein
MSIFNSLFGWLGSSYSSIGSHDDSACSINPANGLPMVGGCGGVDIEGNPYGTDSTSFDLDDSGWMDSSLSTMSDDMFSSFDDSSSMSFSSWDD